MDNFLGEIRAFSFQKTPPGWLPCEGQVLQISQNRALFSLIGTRYGGDGTTNFQLPDLRGRAILGFGQSQSGHFFQIGQAAGAERVTLNASTSPAHYHTFLVSNVVGTDKATPGAYLAKEPSIASITGEEVNCYVPATSGSQVALSGVAGTGGGGGHENRVPSLAIQLCIATTGFWPPRT